MKADREVYSRLEDILFKYERATALVSVLQHLIAEGCVDVTGIPENALNYSLYEIEERLYDVTKDLREIVSNGFVMK